VRDFPLHEISHEYSALIPILSCERYAHSAMKECSSFVAGAVSPLPRVLNFRADSLELRASSSRLPTARVIRRRRLWLSSAWFQRIRPRDAYEVASSNPAAATTVRPTIFTQ